MQSSLKKSVIKWGICCLLLCVAGRSWALDNVYAAPPLQGSNNTLVANQLMTVQDKDYSMNLTGWQVRSVSNVTTLRIDEYVTMLLPDSFKVTVIYENTYKVLGSTSNIVKNDTLVLAYYSNKPYTNRAYIVRPDVYYNQIKVLSVTADFATAPLSSFKDVLLLESEVHSSKDFINFSCTNNTITAFEYQNVIDGELRVVWPTSVEADEYDLEWAVIDRTALPNYYGNGTTVDAEKVFDNNATRVSIRTAGYRIPLIYEQGTIIFYRVRQVQVLASGQRREANWSSNVATGLGRYDVDHQTPGALDSLLNWQATTSFAEEGKRKSVVQFYDGTLRSRQTVTKATNPTGTYTVAAETLYDYQGRPQLQVLPAPSLSKLIKYTPLLNPAVNGAEYTKNLYDKPLSDYCGTGAPAMGTQSGAGRYYSPQNPEATVGMNKYIPDAKGFAFTETKYTQDATGRIAAQGGVGSHHQLGQTDVADASTKDHDTRYYYGTADQEDLDALFGTEVGDASHYNKSMVRDGNGQYSVSYVDMHGRTIATALAGKPAADLDTLASNITRLETKRLLDANNNILTDPYTIQSVKNLLVARPGKHVFEYNLLGDSISIKDCNGVPVCYDCLYDLEITISDDCNNQRLPGGKPYVFTKSNFTLAAVLANPPVGCDAVPGMVWKDSLILAEGSYQITKKLSINKEALNAYSNQVFLPRNTCRSLQAFIDSVRNRILAGLNCNYTCQQCNDSVGTWNSYHEKFMRKLNIAPADSAGFREMAWQQYLVEKAACDDLCENSNDLGDVEAQMLEDMTAPNGQYANDAAAAAPYAWSIFAPVPNGTVPRYRVPLLTYTEADGSPSLVNGLPPTALTPQEFSDNFSTNWAKALLPYHPEYGRLLRLRKFATSMVWDKDFEATATYADAFNKGYLNPTGATVTPFMSFDPGTVGNISRDPFYRICIDSFNITDRKTVMQNWMLNPDGVSPGVTLWALATQSSKCTDGDAACTALYAQTANAFAVALCTADKDAAWQLYRELYLNKKRELLYGIVSNATDAPILPPVPNPAIAGDDTVHYLRIVSPALYTQAGNLGGNPGSGAGYVSNVDAEIAAQVAEACEGYVDQWMRELAPCSYTLAQWNSLKTQLINVCKEGGDADHPYGAASVRPGSSYSPKTFDAVLASFNTANGITTGINCNADLITAPLPYEAQGSNMGDAPEYINDKPDTCVCNNLNALRNSFLINAEGQATLSAYIKLKLNADISEANVQQLLALCNSSGANTCSHLDTAIAIPAALQCNNSPCLSCEKAQLLYHGFRAQYGTVLQLGTNLSPSQQAINDLFVKYMNRRTGFAKNFADYTSFLQSCGTDLFAPLPTVSCSTLTALRNSFLATYNASAWTTPTYDAQGCDISTWSVTDDAPTVTRAQMFHDGVVGFPLVNGQPYLNHNTSMGLRWNLPFCNPDTMGYILETRLKVTFNPLEQGPFRSFFFYVNFTDSVTGIGRSTYIWLMPTGTPYTTGFYSDDNGAQAYAPGLLQDLTSGFRNIKVVVNRNKVHVFVDGALVQTVPLRGYAWNNFVPGLQFQYCTAAVDWVKYSDLNGNVVFDEQFNNGCGNFSRPTLAWSCPVDCKGAFTNYFNQQQSTAYTYAQIAELYAAVCLQQLSLCWQPQGGPTLCGQRDSFPPYKPNNPCDNVGGGATDLGTLLHQAYQDSLRGSFRDKYLKKCMAAGGRESFTVTAEASEYHYTLYYYDQAGSLVKTVPPAGVDESKLGHKGSWSDSVSAARNSGGFLPLAHALPTQYRYNTLGQVTKQRTPDADSSVFWYDRLGRLVVSQNAEQRSAATETARKYSYTLYDYLGRIAEVGEYTNTGGTAMGQDISRDAVALGNWLGNNAEKREVTRTVYDLPNANWDGLATADVPLRGNNLRNRVSYTQYYPLGNPNGLNYAHATYYTYDIHGNVDTLVQDYGNRTYGSNAMNTKGLHNRFKKMVYQYDLISGKVNHVAYQPQYRRDGLLYRPNDAMYHRYGYDAENRLVQVETSADSVVWERDAAYEYYKHGPLARTELGQQQVQGIDYAYTLQGWLKGVNSSGLIAENDIGQDGYQVGANPWAARDAYSYQLNYYRGDYKAINPTAGNMALTPVPVLPANADGIVTGKPLYNGNISSMAVHIPKLGSAVLYGYRYDQLNRIKAMDAFGGLNTASNVWAPVATAAYKERVQYDANGNILQYLRNGNNTAAYLMDSLGYQYSYNANGKLLNNRLNWVKDNVADGTYAEDIDNQAAGNYAYDAIGNLTKDVKEHINKIDWNVYGKIKQIDLDFVANKAKTIRYSYDAAGQRIGKQVENYGSTAGAATTTVYTWYARDASGNVMATYTSNAATSDGTLTVEERHLYGSSRLGMYAQVADAKILPAAGAVDPIKANFTRGNKFFELSNHLGNVLATISDRKIAVDDGTYQFGEEETGPQGQPGVLFVVKTSNLSDGILDYYTADVVTANDYYPFGMVMPGRKFSAGGKYRYGFNGKENDNDVKGEGEQQDYGFRIYSPVLGRFLSIDPLAKNYPWYTPYQFAGNKPINSIDLDGLEEISVFDHRNRTADIIITKIILINREVINTIGTVKSDEVHKIFAKGNETIYLESLPEYTDNGDLIEAKAISEEDYNKGKGFRVNIKYEVSVEILSKAEFLERKTNDRFNQKYSFVSDDPNASFSGSNVPFKASISMPFTVTPGTNGFWSSNSLGYSDATVDELLAHEVGFHNMMRKWHAADQNTGQGIYPQTPTLESNVKGKIYPIHDDSMVILNEGVNAGVVKRDKTYEELMNNRGRKMASISE